MGEVVSTIPTSNGPKRLAENKMLMLRQLAKSCCCFLFATISFLFHGLSFYHLLPSPWRWRKGFSFHFFYSPCFFSWTPLQLRCKLCF
ncbi:hypothetical protein ES332_D03G132200v1 [Gossypium tomentosum]|nr:hypothetical protein ES332_D03G132200v1 [Gossypium tomentosum]TYH80434.1 hypothetical protein ES332_D03G132200v1 [Gossypium tomentosum]TYH80437.1 hypothetical protein ES332_D03G132200v1 [Gossypium tomentosum]